MFNGWGVEIVQHAVAAKGALLAMIAAINDVPRQRYVEAGIIAIVVSVATGALTVPVLKEEIAGLRREWVVRIDMRNQQLTQIKADIESVRLRTETVDRAVLERLASIEATLNEIKRQRK